MVTHNIVFSPSPILNPLISSNYLKSSTNGTALIYCDNSRITINNRPSVNTSYHSFGDFQFINSGGKALEQYRMHLYNYAMNIERLKGSQYTAAPTDATCTSNHTQIPPPHMLDVGLMSAKTPTHMPSSRLTLASMTLFSQRMFQAEEPKPQHSYIGLIALAILSSVDAKLVLSDIYQYILENYPYFRSRGPGWRNSIRHNLSLNDCFIKSGRSANGKGHYWAIHPANIDDFRKGDFRRRKAQRKVRKHMGLIVDDVNTDSPSPPLPMDLTSPSPPLNANSLSFTTTSQQLGTSNKFDYLTQQHKNILHESGSFNTPLHGTQGAYCLSQMFVQQPLPHYTGDTFPTAMYSLSSIPPHLHHSHQQSQYLSENFDSLFASTNLSQHKLPPLYVNPPVLKNIHTNPPESSITAKVLTDILTHTRKRQFDVASLLAPENLITNDEQKNDFNNTGHSSSKNLACISKPFAYGKINCTDYNEIRQKQQQEHQTYNYSICTTMRDDDILKTIQQKKKKNFKRIVNPILLNISKNKDLYVNSRTSPEDQDMEDIDIVVDVDDDKRQNEKNGIEADYEFENEESINGNGK